MNANERISLLERAAEQIEDAIENIREAVNGMGRMEDSVETYMIAHLDNWANGINPHDETIPRLIEKIGDYAEVD